MQNRLLRALVLLLYVLSVGLPALAVPAADKKADVQDLLRKGDDAVLAGKMGVARQSYERAIANGADLATDYTRARNLGMVYMNGTPRDFNKAAKWLDIAFKLRPSADDTRLLLAQSLSWSGKYDAAITHYRELVRKNPDTPEYVSGLANTLYWAGKNDDAFAAYDRFLERRPSNLAMRLEYARVLSFARKLPESTLQYQNVLQADPQNVQAEIGLAKIASWQDDFKGALDRYNKILRKHPELYDALVGKAYTLYWMGKPDEALPLFQKAAKRNPNDKEVAATLKEMGATAQPKKEQPEVAQAKPAETPAGPIEKPAVTKPAPAGEEATLQPETFDTHQKPEARNATSVMMDQAAAAANANNYVEAIHIYHQILEREPQNTQAMIQIARVLSWSRNFKESAAEYDALLQVEPTNMQARLERARVLSWGQDYDASIEEYNRLIKDAELAKAQPPKSAEQPQAVVAQAPAPAPVQPKPVEHPPEHVAPVETPQVTQATKPTAEIPSSLERPQPTVTVQAQPQPQPKPVEQAQAQPQPVERVAPEEQVTQPTLPVDVNEMHLELARVLAWSKRYDESLAQFNVILPPQQAPEAKDKPVLIEKARVLSWAQHYEEAVKTYDVALALDPADIEARLGKGQTLYWWGRLDQAAAVLRPLMQVQALSPESKDTTAFTLAAVQHSRGKNGEALDLLNATAPTNQDAKNLRTSIHQDLRPVWRSTFGWEDDSEIDAQPVNVPPLAECATASTCTVTRVLRWNNALSFNVTPDMRMTVSNVVSHSTTSTPVLGKYGTDATAYETEASIDFRANAWLEMIVGAGEGSVGAGFGCDMTNPAVLPCTSPSGPRTHQFIYDIHPIISHDGWRFEFAAGRHIADYTPLAITANVVRHRWAADLSYTWRNRITYGGEYWHAEYSLDSPQLNPALVTSEYSTAADGGAFWITPTWYRGEHVTIDGGVRWEKFSFDSGALAITQALGSGGFFTPSEYERFSGNGHVLYTQGRWRLDVHGTFGPQKVTGFRALNPPPPTWGTTWSVGSELSATFGRFRPFIAYDWFDTATAAGAGQVVTGNGAYNSHSLVFGFAWRF